MRLAQTTLWLVLVTAAVLLAGCRKSTVSSQPTTDRLTIDAVHAGGQSITIDGALDEPIWGATGGSGAFVAPGSGNPVNDSPVAGETHVAWDDDALYVAFRVDDGSAASPNAADAVDPHIWESASGVEVMLQPGDPGDNRHYYEIQVDVNRAVWDTQFDDYNAPIADGPGGRRFGHQGWSANLERAVAVRPGAGYTVEMALPWASLDSDRTAVPPQVDDVWRANFYSFRDGQRQALAWAPTMGEGNFHYAPRFGRIRFVRSR